MPHCRKLIISNGKTTTTMMIPYVITDYEDWCVKIKGKYKDEERIEIIYVSQKQYERLSIGSHLKLNDDCSLSDDNNTRCVNRHSTLRPPMSCTANPTRTPHLPGVRPPSCSSPPPGHFYGSTVAHHPHPNNSQIGHHTTHQESSSGSL